MSQKSRSLTIDAIKGAAILLVMAGHVLVWNHMEDGIIYDVIKVIQMPLFILVSGYLCGMGRKISILSEYGAKVKKRALSYLTPSFSGLSCSILCIRCRILSRLYSGWIRGSGF